MTRGLPRSAASMLRALEIDTVHVGEIGLATAHDVQLIDLARREGRIIVTLDADFHRLLALSGMDSPSVIRIRIEGLRAEPLVTLIQAILAERSGELEKGVLLTVQPRRIRIHYLPIVLKK